MQEWANFLSKTMGPVVMEPETPAADPVRVTPAPAPRPTPTPRRKTTSGATVGTAPSNVRRLGLGHTRAAALVRRDDIVNEGDPGAR